MTDATGAMGATGATGGVGATGATGGVGAEPREGLARRREQRSASRGGFFGPASAR